MAHNFNLMHQKTLEDCYVRVGVYDAGTDEYLGSVPMRMHPEWADWRIITCHPSIAEDK